MNVVTYREEVRVMAGIAQLLTTSENKGPFVLQDLQLDFVMGSEGLEGSSPPGRRFHGDLCGSFS